MSILGLKIFGEFNPNLNICPCGAKEIVTLAHFTLRPKALAEVGYSRGHTIKVQVALRHSRG